MDGCSRAFSSAWAINVLALIVADWAFDGFAIERWWPDASGPGRSSALANTFLRPIVKFLALPLIIVTLGVAYFFVSMLMLLVHGVGLAGPRDRRLLDVRRRDDRRLARQLAGVAGRRARRRAPLVRML